MGTFGRKVLSFMLGIIPISHLVKLELSKEKMKNI